MKQKRIETREEYDDLVKRGYEPLMQDKWFPMPIALRREIQRDKFGKNDAKGNQKFYAYCIKHKAPVCEECMEPIPHPTAINISHILSRGAHQECSHDPRNVNMLCPSCHARWENGDRVNMLIYKKNEEKIEKLKREYQWKNLH